MDKRTLGVMLIIVGILISAFVFIAKEREDRYIDTIISETDSCYLEDGTCLHEDRDFSVYIIGWIISAGILILGIYLFVFDISDKTLADQNKIVAEALKESKKNDEFKAFLSAFSDDEKNVLSAIREQEGISQSTLRFRTGLSKTALSLMLKSFEEKNLISRKEKGKTKQVFLIRKF